MEQKSNRRGPISEEEEKEVVKWLNKEILEPNYRNVVDLIIDAHAKGETTPEEEEDYEILRTTSPYWNSILNPWGKRGWKKDESGK